MKHSYILYFFIFSLISGGLSAQYSEERKKQVELLEQELHTGSLSDDRLLDIRYELGRIYQTFAPEKAIDQAEKGIELGRGMNDTHMIAFFHKELAHTFLFSGKYDQALETYRRSLELLEQVKRESKESLEEIEAVQAEIHGGIGRVYEHKMYFDRALMSYLQALSLAEKNRMEADIQSLSGNIANTYYQMSNLDQAESYYSRMLELSKTSGNPGMKAYALTGLSKVHSHVLRKDYEKALPPAEEAHRIISANPHSTCQDIIMVNEALADIYTWIGQYGKALMHAESALESAKQSKLPSRISTMLYNLSKILLKQEKYRECEQTALQALHADSSNMYLNSMLYRNIAEANVMMENKQRAVEYFNKTLNTHREYSNTSFQSSLSEMEVKYETEKKEMRITSLEEQKRLMTWLSIAGGAVLLSGLATLLFLWRLTVQKKRLASQKIKQLEQEKILIATQAILDGEVRERSRLARDLHDGLGSILAAARYNLMDIGKILVLSNDEAKRLQKSVNLLDESMREMRRVAHHLMPESLSGAGLKQSISDFCNSIPIARFSYYGDDTRLDPKLEVIIYRIMHELVSNALKHSGASQIIVEIATNADTVFLTVQDDGCGFDVSAQSPGMGLTNIRNRTAAFNGRIDIHSEQGKGTEIHIEFQLT